MVGQKSSKLIEARLFGQSRGRGLVDVSAERARLVAHNILSVNPHAAAVTMRPVTGHPDVATAVINVVGTASVIWAVARRDHIPNTRRRSDGRRIDGRTRSGRKAKANSQEKYGEFFHTRFLCLAADNWFTLKTDS
jgi:hypothetical protein